MRRWTVGEAFKRMRAAAFENQRSRPYQALVKEDLLRASRSTETRFEVTARLANGGIGLAVGSRCIVRETDGAYEVVYGNMAVGRLPVEANDAISACKEAAPSLNGVIPCRVTRIGVFGGVSLELDTGDDNVS